MIEEKCICVKTVTDDKEEKIEERWPAVIVYILAVPVAVIWTAVYGYLMGFN